ncbi:hypothetical protein C8F01DRAFT_1370556, partial [Mycena amicta]
MFPPFKSPSEFYPGLIIWCLDPYEVAAGPTFPIDPSRGKRDLRPCLVVAVNTGERLIQVARFCETQPLDTSLWVRVDTEPVITWKNPDAWIWVGPPATLRMVFDRAKVMQAHRDTSYTTPPVCTQNLDAYWNHRRRFLVSNGTSALLTMGQHGLGNISYPSESSSSDSSRSPAIAPFPASSSSSFVSSLVYPSRATSPVPRVLPWLPCARGPQVLPQHQYLTPVRYAYADLPGYTPAPPLYQRADPSRQSSPRHRNNSPSST